MLPLKGIATFRISANRTSLLEKVLGAEEKYFRH